MQFFEQQRLVIIKSVVFLSLFLLSIPTSLLAQDKLFTQQGTAHTGKVTGVDDQGVWIDLGEAQSKIDRNDISRVEIEIPEQAQEALKLFKEEEYAEVIVKLEPIIQRYEGLPQEWIEQASYILAESYLKIGNFTRAYETFERTGKFFPESSRISTSIVGRGQAACGLKKYDLAVQELEPFVQQKEKVLGLSDSENNDMANACLTLGECYDAQNQKEKALEAFLKVTVLYSINTQAVSQALYRSGTLFEKLNNAPRALGQYRDFLRMFPNSSFAGEVTDRIQKLEKMK